MSLKSVYAKLARARYHASALEEIVNEIFDDPRHRFDFEDVNGVRTYYVREVPSLPPETASILGDFLANMRASLDHLAYQLALRDSNGRLTVPENSIFFPIKESPNDKAGNPRKIHINGVTGPEVTRELIASQPFKAEHRKPENDPLAVLHRLRNIDQHRLLLVVVSVLDPGRMWWGADEGDPTPEIKISIQPVSEGKPVAWFDFKGEEPPATFDPHLELKIRLNHGPPGSLEKEADLLSLVSMIYDHVEHFVIGARFASFLEGRPRHGYSAFWAPE